MKRTIRSLTAAYFQLPLRNPFVISIRTATYANVIRWRLELENGEVFLGECVPVQYVTGETPESVMAVAPSMEAEILGRRVDDLHETVRHLQSTFPLDVAARAGVEIALYSALAAELGRPVIDLLAEEAGDGVRHAVETDLTIARNPNAVEIAKEAWAAGFRIFKIKVGGGSMQEDIDRILGITHSMPDAVIRLDANQALTVESTLELIDRLLSHGVHLELVEQPVPKEDLKSLDAIARVSPVPILADEACKSAEDADRIFSTTAVHGVNVKLMKSGITGAIEIIRVAKAAGKKLMIGCMLESEIGMAASVALACGTGAFDYIDLDGHLLLNLEAPIALFEAQGPLLSFRPHGF
jgi:L-alanine-DL-glutamate epimerase-like enolase superfamily enzyme